MELPTDEQWEQAAEIPPEPPGKEIAIPLKIKRMHKKGPGGEGAEAEQRRKSLRSSLEARGGRGIKRDGEAEVEASSSSRARTEDAFYAIDDHLKAYELEVPMPERNRGWKTFSRNPEAYVASALKKRQVEVSERKLSPEEAKKFTQAKATEVRNFVSSQCFAKMAEKHPAANEILGMRWLLTWKYDPKYEDGKKAKARAVILGYQDLSYASRPTSSPAPSKAGRQLFFQLAHGRDSG